MLINRKVNKNFDKNDIWGITFDKISYIGESGFILPNQKVEFVVDLGVIVVPQEYQKIIIESGKVKSLIERKKCLFENVYDEKVAAMYVLATKSKRAFRILQQEPSKVQKVFDMNKER